MRLLRNPLEEESRVSFTVRVMTPDGIMFVTVIEEQLNGKSMPQPVEILIVMGKTGSAISAWANMAALLSSMLLNRGVQLADIAKEISHILSDGRVHQGIGMDIRSGPEGLKYAFMKYNEHLGKRI